MVVLVVVGGAKQGLKMLKHDNCGSTLHSRREQLNIICQVCFLWVSPEA